jgi:hypothetical protein
MMYYICRFEKNWVCKSQILKKDCVSNCKSANYHIYWRSAKLRYFLSPKIFEFYLHPLDVDPWRDPVQRKGDWSLGSFTVHAHREGAETVFSPYYSVKFVAKNTDRYLNNLHFTGATGRSPARVEESDTEHHLRGGNVPVPFPTLKKLWFRFRFLLLNSYGSGSVPAPYQTIKSKFFKISYFWNLFCIFTK